MFIAPKHLETAKIHLNAAVQTGKTVAKVGAIFTGGVLVGAIAGIVLFFHISNDPV